MLDFARAVQTNGELACCASYIFGVCDCPEPIHPEPLLREGSPVNWQRIDTSTWHVAMNHTQSGAALVVVTQGMEAKSTKRITETQVFDMSDFISCRAVPEFEFSWVG